MAKTDNYIREGNDVLRKENRETKYTVRLYFDKAQDNDHIVEEIQKLLIQTYIRNVREKGGSQCGGDV